MHTFIIAMELEQVTESSDTAQLWAFSWLGSRTKARRIGDFTFCEGNGYGHDRRYPLDEEAAHSCRIR